MIAEPRYSFGVALLSDRVTKRFVIVDNDDKLHVASSWLRFMADTGRSPNTIKSCGSRVAWYLSWTVLTTDWRSVNHSHLALWRRVVESTPARKTNGASSMRTPKTVGLWMTPLRSFYEWADAEGLLTTDVASRMTQLKYFSPGTGAGGECGAQRRVLVPAGGKSMYLDFPGNCSSIHPSYLSYLKWQITNRGTGAKIAGDNCCNGNMQVNNIHAGDYTLGLSADQDSYGTYTLKATYVLP